MPLILFNKPFQVMSQFSAHPERETLSDYIDIPNVYPAGRLDADSEGLLLLTDDGKLQHEISHPRRKQPKTYLAQLEGSTSDEALARLRNPLDLGDFVTQKSEARLIQEPGWLWPRNPPIRERRHQPTSWLALTISEGKEPASTTDDRSGWPADAAPDPYCHRTVLAGHPSRAAGRMARSRSVGTRKMNA